MLAHTSVPENGRFSPGLSYRNVQTCYFDQYRHPTSSALGVRKQSYTIDLPAELKAGGGGVMTQ